jgi:hypothetical protein
VRRHPHLFLSLLLCAWSLPGFGKFLYRGKCELSEDPNTTRPSTFNVCVHASAGSLAVQKSKTPDDTQPPIMHRADGELSFFATPWLSLNTKVHATVFTSRVTKETTSRESVRDLALLQFGNYALSRHRLTVGKGRAVYRIDHQTREHWDYVWGLQTFEAPITEFVTYTYDNQLDMTMQATYGRNPDRKLSASQRAFGSVRIMYDLAALEGTRIALGGFGDGLLRRSGSIGMINVNGLGDQTALELTRAFALNPYDPAEFQQSIRFSYLSHIQDQTRYKFQYDDQFRKIRLGGVGIVYNSNKHTEIEAQIGYAKHEDFPKLSHFYGALRAGVLL